MLTLGAVFPSGMTRFSLVNESLFSVPVYFGHEATKKNLKVNRVTEIGMRKAASGNGISSESDFQSVPNEL
jgi:hypothetical protein